MKKKMIISVGVAVLTVAFTACGSQNTGSGTDGNAVGSQVEESAAGNAIEAEGASQSETVTETAPATGIPDVTVQFGEGGETYRIKMYDNDTAVELVRNIGESGRNLPIYDYDNFEGYEYFQYYDIPSRYEIPSEPEMIHSAKAGEVYYSEPNRVVLFYQDAEISGEYTKVGEIEDITGLREAVEENPVLEGWGNKLILLRYAD